MTDNPCEEIKNQLSHPYIRERQAALKKIEALLAENQRVRECIELLEEVIRSSEYQIVAEKARDILEAWQSKNRVLKIPDDRQLIFGVVCTKCGQKRSSSKNLRLTLTLLTVFIASVTLSLSSCAKNPNFSLANSAPRKSSLLS